MVRGLYTAWTGMQNEQKRLDVIANNIANASTTGYKQEGVTSQSFDDMLGIKVRDFSEERDKIIGKMTLGVKSYRKMRTWYWMMPEMGSSDRICMSQVPQRSKE